MWFPIVTDIHILHKGTYTNMEVAFKFGVQILYFSEQGSKCNIHS